MATGLDELTETELIEAIAGLGQWHILDERVAGHFGKQKKEKKYLANKAECLTCLKDLLIALKHDSHEQGYLVHLKLGEWQVMSRHLLPLLMAYRGDTEVTAPVIKIMVKLTSRVDVPITSRPLLLQVLQDYKEHFAHKDVFVCLMAKMVAAMDDADTQEDSEARNSDVKSDMVEIIQIMCNLVSVPDPQPGEAGFTPLRKTLQKTYIRHFIEENLLDVLLYFSEEVEADHDVNQAWLVVEMLYHILAQIDPEVLLSSRKETGKKMLAHLLERDQSHARLTRASASRHARFGTVMQRRDAVGNTTAIASVSQVYQVNRGSKIWGQNFRNSEGTEKKINMFHDPFFVDLEEGSVRDHNQLNPYVRQSLGTTMDLSDNVLNGLCKSLEEFVQSKFSTMVSFIRGTVLTTKPAAGLETANNRPYGRQILLNFISWILEFHKHRYACDVAKAKANKEEPPVIDIACVQGALDLDMVQFVTARLREYGKEAHIHSSFLALVLRALSHQLKTIKVIIDSTDPETRQCGEILTTNIVKEDVMGHLVWIMKNFRSSSHDPRVLSYTVEIFHMMVKLMKKVSERQGDVKVEFHVERAWGSSLRRGVTTVDSEIRNLADALVIENLFQLLEKYKRHSAQLNSMLVHLIYSIISADQANIVVFFELSYFLRIHRIWSDPAVQDRKEGKKYAEMVELLRYILRQFFKCVERNKCVFVELLFRKTFEKSKDALMDSHQSEFEAILDNYEDAEYAKFLERMRQGEAFDAMRSRQRQLQDGSLPWTAEEDELLKERYSVYADHPLCAELLAAELPEDSRRNSKAVRKRLLELGLIQSKASRKAETVEEKETVEEPPMKKPRMDEEVNDEGDDLNDLEMDLERLLDAAMDSMTAGTVPENNSSSHSAPSASTSSGNIGTNTAPAPTNIDTQAETQPDLDLERELEAMMEDSGSQGFESQDIRKPSPIPTRVDTVPNTQHDTTTKLSTLNTELEEEDLERELESLLETQPDLPTQAAPPTSEAAINETVGSGTKESTAPDCDTGDGDEEAFWEEAVQGDQVSSEPANQKTEDGASSQEMGTATQLSQEATVEMQLENLIADSILNNSQSSQ